MVLLLSVVHRSWYMCMCVLSSHFVLVHNAGVTGISGMYSHSMVKMTFLTIRTCRCMCVLCSYNVLSSSTATAH